MFRNHGSRSSLLVPLLFLAACGDGAESPTELPHFDRDRLGSFILEAQATFPLADPRDLLASLGRGECVVEWYRAPGEYVRGMTSLGIGDPDAVTGWQGFSYGYRTYSGKMIYRATCAIPASRAGKLLTMEQMHMPGLMGEDLPELPAALASLRGTTTTMSYEECPEGGDGSDNCPYEDDEIIVDGEDPCGDGEYWNETTEECACYTDACFDDSEPTDPTDPDDGSTGSGTDGDGSSAGGDGDNPEEEEIGECPENPYNLDECSDLKKEHEDAIEEDLNRFFQDTEECNWARDRIIWALENAETLAADSGDKDAFSQWDRDTRYPTFLIIRTYLLENEDHRDVGNLAFLLAHEAAHWYYRHEGLEGGNFAAEEEEANQFADACVPREG